MSSLTYGDGLEQEEYESMVDTIVGRLSTITEDFFKRSLGVLQKHAKLLAKCSRWQFRRLKGRIIKLGRIRRVGDLLDRIQLYGSGRMAIHLVRSGGLTSRTFLDLSVDEQQRLNYGSVLIKSRNDVVSVQSSKLSDEQMSRVVRPAGTVGGAKILDPNEQGAPRQRKPTRPAVVTNIKRAGDDCIDVHSSLGKRNVRTRFDKKAIDWFIRVYNEMRGK